MFVSQYRNQCQCLLFNSWNARTLVQNTVTSDGTTCKVKSLKLSCARVALSNRLVQLGSQLVRPCKVRAVHKATDGMR